MRFVAEDVAKKVNDALANVTWKDHAKLDARYRELQLSWRKIDPELLAWAKEKQATATGSPTQSRSCRLIYAGRVQRLSQAMNPAFVPLQVLRIGDICIGTSPCETFRGDRPGIQKAQSVRALIHGRAEPRLHRLSAHAASLRTRRLRDVAGTNSLEPQASVKMLDALLEMAAELAPKAK